MDYWINSLLDLGTRKVLYIDKDLIATSSLKIDNTTGKRTVVGGHLKVKRKTKKIEIKLHDGFEFCVFNADKPESLEKMEDQLDDYIGLYNILVNISEMYF